MPTANQVRLSQELKDARRRAGLSQTDVHAATGISVTSLVKYEKLEADGAPTIRKLNELARLYGVEEQTRCLWLDLRRRATERGWVADEPYSGSISPAGKLHTSYEEAAPWIGKYSLGAVHSLLRTRSYAGAMEDGPLTGPTDLDGQVQFTVDRWLRISERQPPPQIVSIMDESVLRRAYGGPAVMIEQLRHLMTLPAWVEVLVVPLERPARAAIASGFTLFELDGTMTAVDDGYLARGYFDRRDQVETAKRVFETLREDAYSVDRSREKIQDIIKEYEASWKE